MYLKSKLHQTMTVVLALTISILAICYTASAQVEPQTGQHEYKFEGGGIEDYLLFLPDSYNEEPDVEWPMIVYFHGANTSWAAMRTYGMPPKVDKEKDFPFIVLSPYYSAGFASPLLNMLMALIRGDKVNWENISFILETTIALMDEISTTYRVDTNRIYATGMSQGGYLTWLIAAAYPERFAAIAPFMGGGDPETGCQLKSVPIWAFHGAMDTTVPLRESEEMVKSVEACGGSVELTVVPGAGHDPQALADAAEEAELYTWFRKHILIGGIHTSVKPNGKLTVTWGTLKQR